MKNGGQPKGLSEQMPRHPATRNRPSWWMLGIVVVIATVVAMGIWWLGEMTMLQTIEVANMPQPIIPAVSKTAPKLRAKTIVKAYDHIWDIAFLPSQAMLFTERKGVLSIKHDDQLHTVVKLDDVYAKGEGGLLGLAVDPEFNDNRFVYVCLNSTRGGPDIRVARLTLKTDYTGYDARKDIVTGISANPTGRHSGCRVRFGPDGYLWIGTGDSATTGLSNQRPQDPASLNGKILRVDRNGKGAPDNLGGTFDTRIFNYGHRNIQGLAFFPKLKDGVLGISVEHGSTVDDEVNLLKPGNFGWDPDTGYTEKDVPMTDTKKFPDAIKALWHSGFPTQAPSGATFLHGRQWKGWNGALVVAFLKDEKLKILHIANNKLVDQKDVLKGEFGRIRSAVQGPDGYLYISTDNGQNHDKIIRLIPY